MDPPSPGALTELLERFDAKWAIFFLWKDVQVQGLSSQFWNSQKFRLWINQICCPHPLQSVWFGTSLLPLQVSLSYLSSEDNFKIHSFPKYLLSTFYVPNTLPSAEDTLNRYVPFACWTYNAMREAHNKPLEETHFLKAGALNFLGSFIKAFNNNDPIKLLWE